MNSTNQFITGAEAAVLGALEGGAEVMYGYPITPSTEILQGWIEKAQKNKQLKYLQTEDETTAGFAVIGSLLAGAKAFTATAGPGTILMQDPMSMAENMRLPFVAIIMQRGGPSTGTVNYSQQEVTLTAFGGNGDGLRVVYSPSTVEEVYQYSAKAFSTAWKYRFPTVVLGDGHLSKMTTGIKISKLIQPIPSTPILPDSGAPVFIRNCFSSEDEFYNDRLKKNFSDWNTAKSKICISEQYKTNDAKELIIAHGSVAQNAREAVDIFRANGRKIGLFRPVTLNPFDSERLNKIVHNVKKIYIVESSLNQLSRIVKYEIFGNKAPIIEISKPAVGFSSNEICKLIMESK